MKRGLSLLTALSILFISLNLTYAYAEDTQSSIIGTAEAGKYTWNFVTDTNASNEKPYDISDEYADLRVSLGNGDSITEKGITFSDSSCKEPTTSAADSKRYLLIKPVYSGKISFKIQFTNATSSAKGRIWYNDFGIDTPMNDADTSTLQKGVGTQIGSDFTNTSAQTLSFDVEAGHLYSLHTYNRASCISTLYYESDEIVGKTEKPSIKTPITETDTEISGTCADGAQVTVKINGGEALAATAEGTQWHLSNLLLNTGDIISVTAKSGDYKESDAVEAVVTANDSICALTIDNMEHGAVTSNYTDNSRIPKGSKVVLTVIPENKYKLSSLTVNGTAVEIDKNNQYSFIIDTHTVVSALFEEKPYHNITLPAETANGTVSIAGGAIQENGAVKAVEGEMVTLSVKADPGFRIKSLICSSTQKDEEIKYSNSFIMPSSDATIRAEFKKENVMSKIDTTFSAYDRLTMTVDNEPFFYNGIQVRADNAADQKGYTDEQIKYMYQLAAQDGFTVVNTQIRWSDVQPDIQLPVSDTGYINGGANSNAALSSSDQSVIYSAYDKHSEDNQKISYIKFALPEIEDNAEYAAVKLRLNVIAASADTALSVYGISENNWDSQTITWDTAPSHNGYEITDYEYSTVSPEWNKVTGSGYYGFDVTDFINANKNNSTVTFAIVCDSESSVTISGADGTAPPQLKLSRDDIYDFTYLDKLIGYAEEYGLKFEVLWFATDTCQQTYEGRVPYYVHHNYQKCLKSDGTPARNMGALNSFIMCKNDLTLRAKEKEVLESVFDHIAEYNQEHGNKNTVVGCQVSNEPAVGRLHVGTDENRYFDRCYCENCQKKYDACLASEATEARALYAYKQSTMWEYLNNLSSAVKESNYSVWTRVNNYMGTDANVILYNEDMRAKQGTDLDMIGIDPYSTNSGADNDYLYSFGHEAATYKNEGAVNHAYGKNFPLVMEYGGNNETVPKSILACIAGGGFFNIYEILSGKENFGIYVDSNNSGNITERGAYLQELRDTNAMLNKVKYDLASKKTDGAGGDTLLFFNPKSDNTKTSVKQIRSLDVTYNTENNGVGIAIEKNEKEMVLLSTSASEFVIDDIKKYGIVSLETGYYDGDTWIKESDKTYTENDNSVHILLNAYDCVKLTAAETIPKTPVIMAVSGNAENGKYSWSFGTPDEAHDKGIYHYSDAYASINVASGINDSVTKENGIYFSDSSCKETDSAQDNNRYILINPEYSGKLSITIRFSNATSSAKGRIYYNDFTGSPDEIDLSTLKKGVGTQLGSDFTNTAAQTLSFDVQAGHVYSLHTYNRASYISEMYMESDEIAVKPDMTIQLEKITVDADGKLNASLINNGDDKLETVTLISAQYHDGIIENVGIFDVSSEGDIDFGNYTINTNTELKLFVWDSLNGMKPLSRIYTNKDIQ